MAIEIGTVNADTSVKLGSTTIQSGYIGTNLFFGNQLLGVLDVYPTSVHHAYSLRRLRIAYGGFCLRVRRTAITSTEVNVSFDSNNAISLNSPITYASGTATTATTLGQFAAIAGYGAADIGVTANQNIFVVTWYDQSGNGKNPTQSTAGQQPRLVSSATADLERSGGKVAVRFVKSGNNFLTLADTTANINNMSSYFVGAFVGSTGIQVGYNLGATNRFFFPFFSTNIYAAYSSAPTGITLETGFNTNRKLYELISPSTSNSSVVEGFTNGVQKGTRPIASFVIANIILGTVTTNYYDGYIQEVIGYQSNANRLEKETNINSYWSIY